MGDKQIYFGMAVGVLTALLGVGVTLVHPSGWGLMVVGIMLSCLSLVVKTVSMAAEAKHADLPAGTFEGVDSVPAVHLKSDNEVRHAA